MINGKVARKMKILTDWESRRYIELSHLGNEFYILCSETDTNPINLTSAKKIIQDVLNKD